MPQFSLYLDQETLKNVKRAARKSNLSISQWVRKSIHESFDRNWPADFFDLSGSITDESFRAPEGG